MKVLLIEGVLHENGATRLNLGLATRWILDGESVRLLVLENPDVQTTAVPFNLPVRFASKSPRRFRSAVWRMPLPLLQEARRAEVVISGSEVGWGVPLGWLAAKVARKPFVVMVQAPVQEAIGEWRPARLRPLLKWVHRHVDLAVCVQESLIESVAANGLPREKAAWFHAGIDIAEIQRRGHAATTAAFGAPGRVVVTVGRLAEPKAYDVLLRAHALATQPHDLVIVGDGPDRAALEGLAAELGISDTVHFTGFLSDPQPLIARADLFVLSSRYEGLGLVLVEALAHGTPVISTDCAGPRYVLDHGRLGDLVPVEDAQLLATAIDRHLSDPSRLLRMAQEGPEWAEKQFDQDRAAEDLWAVLGRFGPQTQG